MHIGYSRVSLHISSRAWIQHAANSGGFSQDFCCCRCCWGTPWEIFSNILICDWSNQWMYNPQIQRAERTVQITDIFMNMQIGTLGTLIWYNDHV